MTDEAEATQPDKPTMAVVWEDLDELERRMLAKMIGVELGVLALNKITNVLKAVMYRYHDNDIRNLQIQQATAAYQAQLAQQQLAHAHLQAGQYGLGQAGGYGMATTNNISAPQKPWWLP